MDEAKGISITATERAFTVLVVMRHCTGVGEASTVPFSDAQGGRVGDFSLRAVVRSGLPVAFLTSERSRRLLGLARRRQRVESDRGDEACEASQSEEIVETMRPTSRCVDCRALPRFLGWRVESMALRPLTLWESE